MPKELYLYSGIYSFTAEDFIRQLEENKNSDVNIRVNTNGGDPQAAVGMLAKLRGHKKDTTMLVDGKAISAGFFLLTGAKKVKATNASRFLVHRAAYSEYYEKNYMTAEEKQELISINTDWRTALEAKVSPAKFASVTGRTYDDVFNPEQRIDIRLNAYQMKELGLVDEIINITDSQVEASSKYYFDDEMIIEKEVPKAENKDSKIDNTMTIEKLKAEHPAIYNQIFALGKEAGVEAEKDRVEACLVYNEIDPKGVKAAIESGKPLTSKQMAEFSLKSVNAQALKDLAADNAKDLTTKETQEKPKSEEEKEIEAFCADVNKLLGRDKK